MQKLLAHTKMKPDPKGDHKRLFAFLSMKLGKRFNKADLAYCPPVMKGNRKEEDWESEDDILGEIRSKKRNRETWGEPRDSREHLKNGTTQPRHVRYDEQLEEEEKERELDGIARETGLDTGGKEEYEKQEENEKKDQSGRQSAADIQVLRPTSAMSVKNKLTAETKRSIEDQFHDLLQVEQVYKLQRSLPAILKKVDDMKLGDAERKAAKKYCQRYLQKLIQQSLEQPLSMPTRPNLNNYQEQGHNMEELVRKEKQKTIPAMVPQAPQSYVSSSPFSNCYMPNQQNTNGNKKRRKKKRRIPRKDN
mmetsp:Transcript_27570/g.44397  ORF Transcript_27570/g.44397 Transcript_27570/m.44397 type:complete len:306 (-) Transcript_27570:221-1138(-)